MCFSRITANPIHREAYFELLVTAGGFVLFWVLMWFTLNISYFLTLLLALPAAGFLVRLFLIQHDCGHGAFFRKRLTNNWVGRVIGTLTFTPYDYWRRSHNIHHATSGNLEHRGLGDIQTLTVNEYLALSKWGRFCYRLYRNPLFLFGIAPSYIFLLQYRLPVGLMLEGWLPWLSTMATNLSISAVILIMIWLIGVGPFLLVQTPILLLATSIGVWLFYVQHQFEDTYWARRRGLEPARCGITWKFSLCPARCPALVYGKYRRSPRASLEQSHSFLQTAAGAA